MTDSKSLEDAYKAYYDKFMANKRDLAERNERLQEHFKQKLGFSVNVNILNGNYDARGDPMTFEDYVDWVNKADERAAEAKKREEEREKEKQERINQHNNKVKKFNDYLETLPKTYTPKDWRDVAKDLDIKNKPIPRGTKLLEINKQNNGLTIKYIK